VDVYEQLRDEVKRLHERCDKLQAVLMQETEQKIESDKKHEELIAKWKRQLEAKAKAFESLQQKFAPPRDLDQLRIKIQEELEGPYQSRIEALQTELERQHQRTFEVRREYEIVKTEYEQFATDQVVEGTILLTHVRASEILTSLSTGPQGNEMECLQQTYEMQLADLKKKLRLAEEKAEDTRNAETIRRLEQLREAASMEIKALKAEVQVRHPRASDVQCRLVSPLMCSIATGNARGDGARELGGGEGTKRAGASPWRRPCRQCLLGAGPQSSCKSLGKGER
jgi:hypothetical protein